jgi:tol-pal system protein YbgF
MYKYFSVVILLLLMFSACATVPDNRTEQYYQSKIAILKKQLQELQKRIEQLETKKKIVRLDEEKNEILRRINKLSEKQEKSLYYLEQIKRDISALKLNIDIKPLRKSISFNPSSSVENKSRKCSSHNKAVKKRKIVNANNAYRKCYKLFVKNSFKKSEECFNNFLSEYPKSHLVANAYFWIGETYFARKNYSKAIDYYDIILTKFSKSHKVSSALLKEGMAFYRLHDKEGAKIFLEKVISDFPNTPQAKWAKNYLNKHNLNNLK